MSTDRSAVRYPHDYDNYRQMLSCLIPEPCMAPLLKSDKPLCPQSIDMRLPQVRPQIVTLRHLTSRFFMAFSIKICYKLLTESGAPRMGPQWEQSRGWMPAGRAGKQDRGSAWEFFLDSAGLLMLQNRESKRRPYVRFFSLGTEKSERAPGDIGFSALAFGVNCPSGPVFHSLWIWRKR